MTSRASKRRSWYMPVVYILLSIVMASATGFLVLLYSRIRKVETKLELVLFKIEDGIQKLNTTMHPGESDRFYSSAMAMHESERSLSIMSSTRGPIPVEEATPSPPKYLLPILLHGSNIQFQGLLEAAIIARAIGRTLVLPLSFHFYVNSSLIRVPIDDVFNTNLLANFTAMKFVDSPLRDLYASKRQWATLTSPVPKVRLDVALRNLGLDCCPGKKVTLPSRLTTPTLKEIFSRPLLAPSTFVAISPYQSLAQSESELLLHAAQFRKRAATVVRTARRLRAALFGESRILAVHIRREISEALCSTRRRRVVCPNDDYTITRDEIIGLVRQHAVQIGVRNIYLAYTSSNDDMYTERRYMLDTLNSAGFNTHSASSFTVEYFTRLASTDISPFQISLVEQEVCVEALGFVHVDMSSWSNTVVLDRRARGYSVIEPIESNFEHVSSPFRGANNGSPKLSTKGHIVLAEKEKAHKQSLEYGDDASDSTLFAAASILNKKR